MGKLAFCFLFCTALFSNEVVLVDKKGFEKSLAQGIIVADFYANWCPPCRQMSFILNQAAKESPYTFVKVDVEKMQDVAIRYGIEGLPTLIIFKDGKEKKRIIGVMDKENLLRIIQKETK